MEGLRLSYEDAVHVGNLILECEHQPEAWMFQMLRTSIEDAIFAVNELREVVNNE